MNIIYDLSSGKNTPVAQPFFAYGAATDITKGALVEAHDTGAEGAGAVERIGAAKAPIALVGLAMESNIVATDGDWDHNGTLTTATNRPEINVDIRPLAVYQAQMEESATTTLYNDADVVAIDITTADSTGASADLISGGWLYDDATEQLRWIEDHDSANSLILNTATTTAITNAQNRKVVFVPQRLYGASPTASVNEGVTLNTLQDGLLIETDETIQWLTVVDHYGQFSKKEGPVRLNPGLHDAASCSSAVFFVDFVIKDHAYNRGNV